MSPPARWDVVVVGAGSAGAVVAARLSERLDRRVLLLEAGPDHSSRDTPPALASANFVRALGEPKRFWDGLVASRVRGTTPVPYLRGRGAGGSSAVNGMVSLRGMPADYDRWANDLGCEGWAWRDVADVFAAVERTLSVSTTPDPRKGPVARAFIDACLSAGMERSGSEAQVGVLDAPLSLTQNRRRSSNDAYLEQARGRTNLEVRGEVTVASVLLHGRRAVGVQLADGAQIEAAHVVVCCGAIHSPALLLASGVERDGIGYHLKDHPSATLTLVLRDDCSIDVDAPVITTVARATSTLGVEGDLQLFPMCVAGPSQEAQRLGVLHAGVMQVASSGRVQLGRSPTHPTVELNMLDDERDLRRLVEGVQLLLAIAAAPGISRVAERVVVDERGTPADVLRSADETSLAAWAREHVGDYVHACGTCRMGPAQDSMAVVDTSGRVHGYDGLYVVDASIMPDLPRANTNLPTTMIAEKISRTMTTTMFG